MKTIFSFKWKVLLPVALVLLSCAIIIHKYVQMNLVHAYEYNRLKSFEETKQVLEGLSSGLRSSITQGQQFLEMLIKHDVLSNPNEEPISMIEQTDLWKTLYEKFGIDGLQIYHLDGSLLSSWGVTGGAGHIQGKMAAAGNQQTYVSRRSRESVECVPKCIYSSTKALLTENSPPLIMVFSVFLNRVVDDFTVLSSMDIALLNSKKKLHDTNTIPNLWLHNFNSQLEAASVFYSTFDLLKKIPQKDIIDYNNQGIDLFRDGKYWSIKILPSNFDNIYFVLISEATLESNKLKQAKLNALQIIFVCFLVILFLVFFLINAPLNRIKIIGHAIPLLGAGKFEALREIIGKPLKPILTFDEVANIHKTAYEVSFHLQNLERRLIEKSERLEEALKNISNQHCFLEQLVDYSQVLVMTLNKGLQITLANALMAEYTCYDKGNLIGMSLETAFGEGNFQSFKQVLEGIDDSSKNHEFIFINKAGQHYWISWIHCLLPADQDANDSKYLSIGVDVTYQRKSERKIKQLAELDSLTGLYNRRTSPRRPNS